MVIYTNYPNGAETIVFQAQGDGPGHIFMRTLANPSWREVHRLEPEKHIWSKAWSLHYRDPVSGEIGCLEMRDSRTFLNNTIGVSSDTAWKDHVRTGWATPLQPLPFKLFQMGRQSNFLAVVRHECPYVLRAHRIYIGTMPSLTAQTMKSDYETLRDGGTQRAHCEEGSLLIPKFQDGGIWTDKDNRTHHLIPIDCQEFSFHEDYWNKQLILSKVS